MSNRIEWQTATVCTVEGCNWFAGITGLCWPHSRRGHFPEVRKKRRANGPLCTVPKCDRTGVTKGLCSRHYQLNHNKKKRERELTGIDDRKKFDREESIALLQSVTSIFGESISLKEYLAYQHENGGPSFGTIKKIFGNWNSFKLAAGLELTHGRRKNINKQPPIRNVKELL